MEHRRGSAQDLHRAELSTDRRIVVQHVDVPTLVLGSTQSTDDVDADELARSGVQLARRRSGGGAVLLVPDEHEWVDVTIGVDDPLWTDDVTRSSWWLGEAWAASLGSLSTLHSAPVVHRGRLAEQELSRVVCFAAIGPGEVSMGVRKVVGISQRRTRSGARFQCVIHRRWDPTTTLSLLSGPWSAHPQLVDQLTRHVAGLDDLSSPHGWSVVEDLLGNLP